MKQLRFKAYSNTRQIAEDLYTVKYNNFLLQVLCDNLDSVMLDYITTVDRLRMTGTMETKMKLSNILRLCKSLKASLSEVCARLDENNLTNLSDGLNEMLRLFRRDADTSDNAYEHMITRLTATFKTVKLGQELYPEAVKKIEELEVKPTLAKVKGLPNGK